MCSRFELNATPQTVAARFRLSAPPPLPMKTEVRPTDEALVIGRCGPRLARFGLPGRAGRPLVNARAETLAELPTFRRLMGARVLIPATAWWEWRKPPGARKGVPNRIVAGDGLFAFAGLIDGDHFVVVTCVAAASIAGIHDRMPAVLPPEAEAEWLDGDAAAMDLGAVLSPYAGALSAREAAPPRPPDLFDP